MSNHKRIIFTYATYTKTYWEIPYLPWFKDTKEDIEKLISSYYTDFVAKEDDDDDDDEEEDQEEQRKMWDLDFLDSFNLSEESNQVEAKLYQEYFDQSIEYYSNLYKIDKTRIKYISLKNKLDDKHLQTMELMKDKNVDLIINPSFINIIEANEKEIVANASFPIYDKIRNKIVMLCYSSHVRFTYAFRAKFFYDLLKDLEINVKEISVLLSNSAPSSKIFKGKVTFVESFAFRNALSVRNEKVDKEFAFLHNSGLVYCDQKYNSQPITFMTYCKYNALELGYTHKSKKDEITKKILISEWPQLFDSNNKKSLIINFKDYKEEIKFHSKYYFEQYTKKEAEILKNLLDEYEIKSETSNKIGSSYKFCEKKYLIDSIIKKTLFTLIFSDIYGNASNNLFRQGIEKDIRSQYESINNTIIANKDFVNLSNDIFSKSKNFISVNALNIIKNIFVKDKRIVWYDYEGFSTPIPPMDNVAPHRQIVSQVSIIETKNGDFLNKLNIVIDPLKELTLANLAKVLVAIYSNKADHFVVFNKTYENKRNEEILELIKKNYLSENKDPELLQYLESIGGFEQLSFITDYINRNVIDINECFKISSNLENVNENLNWSTFFEFVDSKVVHDCSREFKKGDFMKSQHIFLKELNYKHSIKLIEKIITKFNLDLKVKIHPYSSLEVKNGLMAMENAILRYAGVIGDSVWKVRTEELKKYCENDVRAMIMVYEFILYLFRKNGYDVDQFEYKIDKNFGDFTFVIDENKKLSIKKTQA